MLNSKCKICRRFGQKLFLKGERCLTQKCSMVRRPYAPGQKGKRRKSPLSDYGIQIQEKQKVRLIYGLGERQFKKYVKDSLSRPPKEGKGFVDFLVEKLESRLDNVVFRAGIADSRAKARLFVNHGHFLVNGKKVNLPSLQVKKGDIISIKEKSKKLTPFKNLPLLWKRYQPPSWLELDKEKMEAKIVGIPSEKEANIPADLQKVGEFYSR